MKHASLFSGIGGPDLAAEWMGWENVFHCEKEQYKLEQLIKNFPNITTYGDITTTEFTIHRGGVGVLTGGFPCQDASIAKSIGTGQQGLQGSRTALAFHMLRAIDEIRPRYVVAENVENFLKVNKGKDFRTILSELAGMGYNAEWRVCRASDVGAPHHRSRLYIVAYPSSFRLQPGQTFFSYVHQKASQISWVFNGTTVQTFRGGYWSSEPPILCLDDGIPSKLVRRSLHGYGNAIVPQIMHAIFKGIAQQDKLYK